MNTHWIWIIVMLTAAGVSVWRVRHVLETERFEHAVLLVIVLTIGAVAIGIGDEIVLRDPADARATRRWGWGRGRFPGTPRGAAIGLFSVLLIWEGVGRLVDRRGNRIGRDDVCDGPSPLRSRCSTCAESTAHIMTQRCPECGRAFWH